MSVTLALAATPVLAAAKASTKSSGSGSFTFILFLVVIGLAGYFLLLRPQQQRARRQRSNQSQIAVGDEILTIGGIVGTVLELDAERVTIVTGVDLSGEGGPGGVLPTRMVLVRNAIARKLEPVVMPSQDGLAEAELDDGDDSRDDGDDSRDDGDDSRDDGDDGRDDGDDGRDDGRDDGDASPSGLQTEDAGDGPGTREGHDATDHPTTDRDDDK